MVYDYLCFKHEDFKLNKSGDGDLPDNLIRLIQKIHI